MSRKTLVMLGLIVGSIVGGYVPMLFGDSFLSYSSVIGNAVGGLLGIVIVYKVTAGYS